MLGAEALDRIRLQLKVPIRCAAVGVEPSEVALEGLIELPARLIAPQLGAPAAQLGEARARLLNRSGSGSKALRRRRHGRG